MVMGGAGDRIGYRRAYAISFLLMSIALILLLFAKEIWLFYLFAAPFGFAYGGMSALAAPIIADLFGLRAHSVIMGSTSFGATVGAAIGPVLASHFFDTTGSYQMAFLTCIGVSIVGFIVVSFLRPISRD
ncbi:MFS transporter [Chloroflexota bacterium]